MAEIIIHDNLTEIKRMLSSDPFKALEQAYQKEVDKLKAKTFNPNCCDEEALIARWQVISLTKNDPRALLESTLRHVTKNVNSRHPEMFK